MLCSHLDIKPLKNKVICNVYPRARHTRLPFSSSVIKYTTPFQLIHIDVWGPYTQPTYTSCSYFLTIVDDFTRCTWVFLMKQESESVSHITTFLKYAVTKFHCTVQIVRSDNAKEFCEGSMLRLFQSKGIVHQISCRDPPQQNGVVE